MIPGFSSSLALRHSGSGWTISTSTSNPWPPRYRCDALPTELWSNTLGARSIYWVHISREEWNDVNICYLLAGGPYIVKNYYRGFQARGHSFSLYGPTLSRQITFFFLRRIGLQVGLRNFVIQLVGLTCLLRCIVKIKSNEQRASN